MYETIIGEEDETSSSESGSETDTESDRFFLNKKIFFFLYLFHIMNSYNDSDEDKPSCACLNC